MIDIYAKVSRYVYILPSANVRGESRVLCIHNGRTKFFYLLIDLD